MKRGLFLGMMLAALLLFWSGREKAAPADGAAEIPEEWKYVALTFDDGPRADTTERLLTGLRERGASATFFLIGEQVEANRELVLRMAEEGHQLGNHTWSHQRLDQIPLETALGEIRQTEDVLEALCGPGDYWLRPPYGQVSPELEAQVGVPMVKWSVDPRDWESKDAGKVTRAILEAVKPNSIILLHDIYPTSVDAALGVVDTLQEQGYRFVTVAELLELNGVAPEAGVLYRTGKGSGYE